VDMINELSRDIDRLLAKIRCQEAIIAKLHERIVELEAENIRLQHQWE